jgi:cellulose synthase (UDP-forming)
MTRRAGAGAVVAASLGYVIWRVIATVPHRPSWAALYMWAVLAAEVGLVWHYSWLVWLLRTFRDRTIEVAHIGAGTKPSVAWAPTWPFSSRPTMKGLQFLLRAIAGAVRQDHSSFEVCVLDDGARPWVAEMCARQGVRYFARDERRGAKAGNLNAALRALMDEGRAGGPEFIGVLDADFVAQPGFLADTLALMHDRRVGLVQTPQYFYNPDPLQYAFPGAQLPDELRFAFDVSQPARDAAGEAYCCGTGFLARMEALRAIGLFPKTP